MVRHIVPCILLAIACSCAASNRAGWHRLRLQKDSPIEGAGDTANAAAGKTQDVMKKSPPAETYKDIKSVVADKPQDVGEAAQAAAKIGQAPKPDVSADKPLEVPGAYASSVAKGFASWNTLITFVSSMILLCLCAFLYQRYKEDPVPRAQAGASADLFQKTWRFGLFDCFSADKMVILCGCCCPAIRWADTMRLAGIFTFWVGVAIYGSLSVLGTPTAGLTGLVMVGIATMKRREVRTMFNMDNDTMTCGLDFCTYLCCSCCAVVQEARQLEEAHAVKHQAITSRPTFPLRAS